jgi:dephospho-CoA kinase
MSQFIVGLTGGIGCGKTTVSQFFTALGVESVDADIVAREVVQQGSDALTKITERFGPSILLADGSLDRRQLRSIIFHNETEKHWLNHLLHPLIRQQLMAQLQQCQSPYALLIAPLLLENNLTTLVHRVLVIDVPESIQLQRSMQRDNADAEQIKAIMNSQISRQARLAQANDVIDNSSNNLDSVKEQVEKLHQYYLSLAQQDN